MNQDLQTIQQVLRALTLALAFATKADKEKFAYTLQTLSAAPDISDDARIMLLDLAKPFDLGQKKN